jgi:hypothetical protein
MNNQSEDPASLANAVNVKQVHCQRAAMANAKDLLPCTNPGPVSCFDNGAHYGDCPAFFRKAVMAALVAAERRGREGGFHV